jgi:PIN domain nuclease of toxin-antitoxin system
MKLLLDTHTFLWFIDDSPRLSASAKSLLESDAELLLSTASLWEIAIKVSIGKLALARPFNVFIPEQLAVNTITELPINLKHLGVVSSWLFLIATPLTGC